MTLCGLLSLLLVSCFGCGLGGLPPRAVLGVPGDGLLQTLLEISVRRTPSQFGPQLGRIDRITTVMTRAIPHPVEVIGIPAHHRQDVAQYGDVVAFPVRADQIGLAETALRQDRPHRGAVILRMDPVAHVQSVAVQLRSDPFEDVRDLPGDELLHMLVRAVIVAAVRDGHAHPESTMPCAHQQVRARLRRRIRARRMIRGLLGELRRIIQRQIAVHLVGGNVVVAHVVLARGLQQAERALHVRLQERLGVRDGIVVVGFGRVVHDRVVAGHQLVEQLRIADIAVHELDPIPENVLDVLEIARIRQGVQHGDMHVGMIVVHVVHKIRTDKAAATGHDDVLGGENLFCHDSQHKQKSVATPLSTTDSLFDRQGFRTNGASSGCACSYRPSCCSPRRSNSSNYRSESSSDRRS